MGGGMLQRTRQTNKCWHAASFVLTATYVCRRLPLHAETNGQRGVCSQVLTHAGAASAPLQDQRKQTRSSPALAPWLPSCTPRPVPLPPSHVHPACCLTCRHTAGWAPCNTHGTVPSTIQHVYKLCALRAPCHVLAAAAGQVKAATPDYARSQHAVTQDHRVSSNCNSSAACLPTCLLLAGFRGGPG